MVADNRDRAVVLGAHDAAAEMLASDEPALAVARIAIAVVGRLAKHADRTGLLVPAPHTIARHVAPDQIAAVPKPYRPLAPARAGPQPLDARQRQPIFVKTRIERFDQRVEVTLAQWA